MRKKLICRRSQVNKQRNGISGVQNTMYENERDKENEKQGIPGQHHEWTDRTGKTESSAGNDDLL